MCLHNFWKQLLVVNYPFWENTLFFLDIVINIQHAQMVSLLNTLFLNFNEIKKYLYLLLLSTIFAYALGNFTICCTYEIIAFTFVPYLRSHVFLCLIFLGCFLCTRNLVSYDLWASLF